MSKAPAKSPRAARAESSRWLLVLGIIVLVVCTAIPSPHIEGQNTGFMRHFGGGLLCGFIWLYVYRVLDVRLSALAELVTLYALVCSLGVAVELVEVASIRLHILEGSILDTTWDLVADTLGAFAFWLAYRLVILVGRKT